MMNNLNIIDSAPSIQVVYDAADKTNKDFERFLLDVVRALNAPDGSDDAMVEVGEDRKVNVHSLPGMTTVNLRADFLSRDSERGMAMLEMLQKVFNQLTSMAGNM